MEEQGRWWVVVRSRGGNLVMLKTDDETCARYRRNELAEKDPGGTYLVVDNGGE